MGGYIPGGGGGGAAATAPVAIYSNVLGTDVNIPTGSPGAVTEIMSVSVVAADGDTFDVSGNITALSLANGNGFHYIEFTIYVDGVSNGERMIWIRNSYNVNSNDSYYFPLQWTLTGLTAGTRVISVRAQNQTSSLVAWKARAATMTNLKVKKIPA